MVLAVAVVALPSVASCPQDEKRKEHKADYHPVHKPAFHRCPVLSYAYFVRVYSACSFPAHLAPGPVPEGKANEVPVKFLQTPAWITTSV